MGRGAVRGERGARKGEGRAVADRLCIKLFSTLNIGVQQVLGGSFRN